MNFNITTYTRIHEMLHFYLSAQLAIGRFSRVRGMEAFLRPKVNNYNRSVSRVEVEEKCCDLISPA